MAIFEIVLLETFVGFDGKKSDVWVDRHHTAKKDKQTVIDQINKGFIASFIPENGYGSTIAHGVFNVRYSKKCYEIFFKPLEIFRLFKSSCPSPLFSP